MEQRRTKVAVVGTGAWWGREHARVFSSRPDARLCAVAGRSPARTEARAREFGVNGYVDLGEMLERERPDLVSLCVSNEGHFEPTLQVIRAGFPLFVEKPLVFDLDEADVLLGEAAARSLFFGINFNHRYARPVVMAVEAVRAGALGKLVFATWRFGGDPGTSSHAHAKRESAPHGCCYGRSARRTCRRWSAPGSTPRCAATWAVRWTQLAVRRAAPGEPGAFAVTTMSNGQVVGFCYLGRHQTGAVELSYTFLPEHWGRGYAREAAAALLAWGPGAAAPQPLRPGGRRVPTGSR